MSEQPKENEMKFDKVNCYGSAGGYNRKGSINAQIEASECSSVKSVEDLVKAAPNMLKALIEVEQMIQAGEVNEGSMEVVRNAIASAFGEIA